MSRKLLPHQDPSVLLNLANQNLNYGQIAKRLDVGALTIVKWMVLHGIFTPVPDTVYDNFIDLQRRYIEIGQTPVFGAILMGEPAIKKNSNPTRNGMRLPNKNYAPYEAYFVAAIRNHPIMIERGSPFSEEDFPLTMLGRFFKSTKRDTDISNLYEAPQDVLVKSGILPDDNYHIIGSHHTDSDVLVDKIHPRTELIFFRKHDILSLT